MDSHFVSIDTTKHWSRFDTMYHILELDCKWKNKIVHNIDQCINSYFGSLCPASSCVASNVLFWHIADDFWHKELSMSYYDTVHSCSAWYSPVFKYCMIEMTI